MSNEETRIRLRLNSKLYDLIKEKAREKGINKDLYIEEALEHYLNYEKNQELEDDIYTNRLNELTQSIQQLIHQNSINTENMKNRLDLILQIEESTDYLH
ncbi:hypothetical protein [Staphylococcus massiliensis]|uniref:hypothetical protein n=1 Tax=Staphylococcus massiliensis TaxID=555791 RepID=UPI001EE02241|nr:hypothetical protein [Staphylococcus massiliensis]MCG3400728.1 hypothetical protein [Staphylococcus massiliensis]